MGGSFEGPMSTPVDTLTDTATLPGGTSLGNWKVASLHFETHPGARIFLCSRGNVVISELSYK